MATPYHIPKGINESDQTIFGRSLKDILLVVSISFFPPVVVWGYSPVPIPDFIGFTLLVLGTALMVTIFWKAPLHTPISEWVRSVVNYFTRSSILTHIMSTHETGRDEQSTTETTETTRVWEVSGDRTQQLTQIDQFHVDDNVAERPDGTYVAGIRVSGVNLTFASDSEQQSTVNQFTGFLNDNRFPMQVFVTSKDFAFESHQTHYEDRVDDMDIKQRPILEELLYGYNSSVLQSTNIRQTNRREYYIFVPVDDEDVISSVGMETESAMKDRVRNLPILSWVFDDENEVDEDRIHRQKLDEIDRRTEFIMSGIISINGVGASRVTSSELALVCAEYWTGESYQIERNSSDKMMDTTGMRTTPFLGRKETDER